MRIWSVLPFITFLQAFLFSAHWFIFHTLISFLPVSPAVAPGLKVFLLTMSFSFVAASVLAFRYGHPAVGLLYKLAAVWLGLLNFLFWAACLCWPVLLAVRLSAPASVPSARLAIGSTLSGLAVLATLYGLINARMIRERRITVTLPNLPRQWRGRTALVVSDIHLGHVNGRGFTKRIAQMAQRLNPSVVFLAGDVYDGTKVDPVRLIRPLSEVKPPFGVYFSAGNHDEFGDAKAYLHAIQSAGVEVLHSRRVDLDGLQLIGISYTESNYPARLRTFLEALNLPGGSASVLLNHVPHRLPLVEQAGVSLQISGHTHGGQFFPFNFPTRWVYGKFTYGLQTFQNLQVLTSYGVGTWGPPVRVGTRPEVVLITFA